MVSSPTNTPASATSPTTSSISVPSNSEDENAAAPSNSRPHAPVAKTLHKQEQKHALSPSPTSSDIIPNLLHSGKFPPPPRSPRHGHTMSTSPPPIMNDLPFVNSPVYPAAPPGTPYTPHGVKTGLSLPHQGPPPSSSDSPYKLNHRPSPPPPFHEDDHYHELLTQYQSKAISEEKSRVESLKEHELQYTTLDEYKHALSRERRHSLSLVQELAYHKFNSKYQSCQLYSEAEMNEEAKVNLLIKNMEGIIKSKDEDKVRTVMELEREEERMINVLMERLERVNREKGMLERQIYGSGGTGGLSGAGRTTGAVSRFENMEGVELVVPTPPNVERRQNVQDGEFHAVVPKYTKDSSDIAECDDEDDGEEEDDQDILGDRINDPDMEKELGDLLERKAAEK